MSETKAYPHGTFSWADLSSTDGEGAKTFYTQLFGWTAVDSPLPNGGVYTMMQLDGKDIVGTSDMGEERKAAGMPSLWNSYISVDDLEAATAKAESLGATIIAPPFDVMEAGRMSVIQDPTGAIVSFWKTVNHRGSGIFNVAGALSWNELATRDVETAIKFYTECLGWTIETDDSGYNMIANNGRPNGGIMQMDDNWPAELPAYWAVYLSVADLEATAALAVKLGGQINMPPTAIGAAGSIAVIQDPQGAVFTAIQMNAADETLPGE